jgi:hypothetical protein
MSNQEVIITNRKVLNMLSLFKSDEIIESKISNYLNISFDLNECGIYYR